MSDSPLYIQSYEKQIQLEGKIEDIYVAAPYHRLNQKEESLREVFVFKIFLLILMKIKFGFKILTLLPLFTNNAEKNEISKQVFFINTLYLNQYDCKSNHTFRNPADVQINLEATSGQVLSWRPNLLDQ